MNVLKKEYLDHDDILFSSEIIDSEMARRREKWFYWVGIFGFLDYIIISMTDNLLHIILIALIPGSIALWGYFKFVHKKLGKLFISSEAVFIDNGFKEFRYDFADISDVEIIRGSRYHYDYQIDNEEKTSGNFIGFRDREERMFIEFLIDSKGMNERFESMLSTLFKKEIKISYKSV